MIGKGFVTTDRKGDVAILKFEGDLGFESLLDIKAAFQDAGKNAKKFVVDLGEARYLGSAAAGVLISRRAEAINSGGGFALCNVPANVLDMLELLGMTEFLEIYGTLQDAVDCLKG